MRSGSKQAQGQVRSAGRVTVVHVMTVATSLRFLSGQVAFMRCCGFTVHAITAPGEDLESFGAEESIAVHGVAMARRITPVRDLGALWRIWRALRRIHPEIVHAHTPKGGLLGMLAAWLARTPGRIYHLRGLPLVTATGPRRMLLRWTERTSCLLAHRVLAVSHSLRNVAIEERLCSPEKIKVLLGGSGNGIDATGRFRPSGEAVRLAARAQHGLPADAVVIGFVGRLAREKGIAELASAWARLREADPRRHLLLVGPFEEHEPLPEEVVAALRSDARVHLTGLDLETPRLYSAMDVVALPTYREGFPNVALEAAAMALPIVTTRVPGCVDAVLDGITGTLVAPRDPVALADALERYLGDPLLRARHGQAARRRVLAEFSREAIWEAVVAEYDSLLARTGLARESGATPAGGRGEGRRPCAGGRRAAPPGAGMPRYEEVEATLRDQPRAWLGTGAAGSVGSQLVGHLLAIDSRVGHPVARLAASPMARRVATGAFWTLFGSGLSRLLALVAAVLVARHLGAASFGEFNLVQTTAGMMMALGGFGLNTTTTKFLAGKYRADPRAAGRVVALSGIVSAAVGGGTGVLLAVLAPWVARDVLGAPQLEAALRVGSLLLLFGPINGTQLGVLMGLERFRLIAGVTTLSTAMSIPLLVAGAWRGGMFGAVVALVVSSALTTVLYRRAVIVAGRRAGVRPLYREAMQEWRLLFSYSLPMTLSNIVVAPVTWIGSAFIANQVGGVRELGLYAAANQWRNAIMLVATSAGSVLFPLFSHLHDSGRSRSFSRAFWTSVGATAGISALGAGALCAAAPLLMHIYGAEFGAATGVLMLLVIAGALCAPLTIVGHALVGAGRMWLVLALSILWGGVLVSAAYALRARGAVGLSVAHVAAYGVHLLVALGCASVILRSRGAAFSAPEPQDVAREQPGA